MAELLSTAVRSSLQKNIILLSNIAVIIYDIGSRKGVEDINFLSLLHQQALILFMILMQKLREQFYKKDKIGNRLKFQT